MTGKERNIHGFEKIYLTYHSRLVNYASKFVDALAVEDLVQDAFVKFWTKYPGVTNQSEASRLLFTITRNTCLNFLKSRSASEKVTLDSGDIGEERLYNYDFHFSTAEKDCLSHELQAQVDGVLKNLPEKCRQVFEMSRIDGLRNKEIAEELGISVSAVEKHIARALRAFENAVSHDSTIAFKILVLTLFFQ